MHLNVEGENSAQFQRSVHISSALHERTKICLQLACQVCLLLQICFGCREQRTAEHFKLRQQFHHGWTKTTRQISPEKRNCGPIVVGRCPDCRQNALCPSMISDGSNEKQTGIQEFLTFCVVNCCWVPSDDRIQVQRRLIFLLRGNYLQCKVQRLSFTDSHWIPCMQWRQKHSWDKLRRSRFRAPLFEIVHRPWLTVTRGKWPRWRPSPTWRVLPDCTVLIHQRFCSNM